MQKYLYFYSGLQAKADWAGKSKAEDIYLLSEGAKREPNCPVLVEEIADKTVLIVGYGSIGAAVEARLKPFGCKFLRLARSARDGVSAVSALDDLLPLADVVILVTPLTQGTRHLINAPRIARMKPGALLVNVGRGGVVETDALVKALTRGLIRAALDVTDPEPLPAEHPLWKFSNVILTPHVAGQAPQIASRHLQVLLDNLRRFQKGAPLVNVVEKKRWF